MTVHIDTEGLVDHVARNGEVATVMYGSGYFRHLEGKVSCRVEDTGNGLIANFYAASGADRDHAIALDYSQARALVLALAEFQDALGFWGAA